MTELEEGSVPTADFSRRFGWGATLVGGGLALAYLVGSPSAPWWTYGVGVVCSIIMGGLCFARTLPPHQLSIGALAYQIVIVCLTAAIEKSQAGGGLSWVAFEVALFPAFLPANLKRTALTSLVCLLLATLLLWPGALSFCALALAFLAALLQAWRAPLGRNFGSYKLEEKLGQGGMGEVWRVTHRTLHRPAALKLIPQVIGAGAEAEESRLRFHREARATAALTSVHTVHLHDFGLAQDGSIYYVMELLDGIDLHRLVENFGPLPPSRVVYLLAQACLSLHEAHEAGLVHRDIKPANIVVCRLGLQVDFVKVLDFGLVSAPPQEQDLQLTAPNSVFGTTGFMSPEQAAGEPLDRRADIYALGCVGYWLLTGRLVFQADRVVDSLVDLYRRRPDPPSQHSLFPVPAELDKTILDCLAKRAEDRPQSAELLRRRLVEGVESWSEDQSRDWWNEHMPLRSQGSQPS